MKKNCAWIICCLLTSVMILLTAHWGSQAVSVLSETAPIQRNHCIIIDPGHGGVDGGATSCSGILESRYNLEISLRLNDLFQLLGYGTRMIRTNDISVYTEGETIAQKKISDLKHRVKIVNGTENALLISIHQNTFSSGNSRGAQVFFSRNPDSEALAKALQSAFRTTVNPGSKRMSKPSKGIYLMEHIQPPGILVECGFLSHPEEDALLRSPAYQKQLCCVIATTVSQFLTNT